MHAGSFPVSQMITDSATVSDTGGQAIEDGSGPDDRDDDDGDGRGQCDCFR